MGEASLGVRPGERQLADVAQAKAYSKVKLQMSAKEGYSKVLSGAGTDGISDAKLCV